MLQRRGTLFLEKSITLYCRLRDIVINFVGGACFDQNSVSAVHVFVSSLSAIVSYKRLKKNMHYPGVFSQLLCNFSHPMLARLVLGLLAYDTYRLSLNLHTYAVFCK